MAGGGALRNNPGDPVLEDVSVGAGGGFKDDLSEESNKDWTKDSKLSLSSLLLEEELPTDSILLVTLARAIEPSACN